MLPPCFRLAEHLFPLVRQEAAHRMAAAGHTQSEIGRRLGVSQAMVSKYLKSGAPKLQEEDAWIVRQMAQEITHLDAADEPSSTNGVHVSPWCRTLALTTGEHHEERRRLVAALLTLQQRLANLDVGPLMPAVGMNLAGALPQARDREDVAAFPGRLALVKGVLRAHGPPEFGASNHLARLLVHAQRDAPEVRFVVNLAGTPDVLKTAHRLEPSLVEGDGNERDEAGVAPFTAPGGAFALVDPGSFGIEPALYLVDPDGAGLASRLERLAAKGTGRRATRKTRA